MRRELRSVRTEQALGYVDLSDGVATFSGAADEAFGAIRRERGDREAAQSLIDFGWSNGYLYLAEATG